MLEEFSSDIGDGSFRTGQNRVPHIFESATSALFSVNEAIHQEVCDIIGGAGRHFSDLFPVACLVVVSLRQIKLVHRLLNIDDVVFVEDRDFVQAFLTLDRKFGVVPGRRVIKLRRF